MSWTRLDAGAWMRVGALGVCAAALMLACARGGDSAGGGGEGNVSTSGSGGAGGTNPTGGGGVGLSGGDGPGGSGGTTTTTTSCSEVPCKLVPPQCGCAPGEKCTWSSQTDAISCEQDGSDQVGEECTLNSCAAGGLCLSWGTLSMCKRFCASDNDCDAPGGRCILEIDGFAPRWCSDNCDLTLGVGCDPAGSKCELGQAADNSFFTVCVPAGPGTQGSGCPNGYEDCGTGFGCINVNATPTCLKWCNVASPSCPGGTTCGSLNPQIFLGAVEYGACL